MARPKFDPKELEPTGKFYPMTRGIGGVEMPLQPILQRPIGAYDNIKLLIAGKRPYWIPVGGFADCDVVGFRPRVSSDNVANHLVMDGGPAYDFSPYGDVMRSTWFDLDWVMTDIGGCTVMPGKPKVPDITKWEEYISMPDLEAMDWDEMVAQNQEFLSTDKMNQLGIYCGLWERMMSLMDVGDACLALVDEELKPHTHRFLDAFSDFLIGYIDNIKKRLPINNVLLHEDWAHQRGPFFSIDVAREMLVPYVKKISDYCHANDITIELHMCGAVEQLIPTFFECGFDMWSMIQPLLYNCDAIVKAHKDIKNFVWGITAPLITPDYSDADMRAAAKHFVEEYKDCSIMVSFFNMDPDFPGFHPGLQSAIYEYSRLAFEDCED